MTVLQFDNAIGRWEVNDTNMLLSAQALSTGHLGVPSAVGARGNYTSLRVHVSSRWYPVRLQNAATTKHWYTYDVRVGSGLGDDGAISHSISGRVTSSSFTYFAVGWIKLGATAFFKVRLWKLNFDGALSPQNWTVVATGTTQYAAGSLHIINVGAIEYDEGATADVDVYVDGDHEINVDGVSGIGAQDLDVAEGWGVFNWTVDEGKDGASPLVYYGNFIWNDEEGTGDFGSGSPCSNDYVVVAHQFEADTSEAARDDWTPTGDPPADQSAKYHRIDDNKGSHDPGDDFIYVGQDTSAEQAFAVVDHPAGTVEHIIVVAEVFDDTPSTGRAGDIEAAPIAATGGADWSGATVFDNLQVSFRRKTLREGEDLRVYQAYVLALGTSITNPANNAAEDNDPEAPTGSIDTYVTSLQSPKTWCYVYMWLAPPEGEEPPAGYAHVHVVMI